MKTVATDPQIVKIFDVRMSEVNKNGVELALVFEQVVVSTGREQSSVKEEENGSAIK